MKALYLLQYVNTYTSKKLTNFCASVVREIGRENRNYKTIG